MSINDLTDERFVILQFLSFADQFSFSVVCKEFNEYWKNISKSLWKKIDLYSLLEMCGFNVYVVDKIPEHAKREEYEEKLIQHFRLEIRRDSLKREEFVKRFLFGISKVNTEFTTHVELPEFDSSLLEVLPKAFPKLEELVIHMGFSSSHEDSFFNEESSDEEQDDEDRLFSEKAVEQLKKLTHLQKFVFCPFRFTNSSSIKMFSKGFMSYLDESNISTNLKICYTARKNDEWYEFHCYSSLIRCKQFDKPVCLCCWYIYEEEGKKQETRGKFHMVGDCDVCRSSFYTGSHESKKYQKIEKEWIDDDSKFFDKIPRCVFCFSMGCDTCHVEIENEEYQRKFKSVSKTFVVCIPCLLKYPIKQLIEEKEKEFQV